MSHLLYNFLKKGKYNCSLSLPFPHGRTGKHEPAFLPEQHFYLAETVTCTAINLCKLICTSKITPQCCAFTLQAWLVFHSQQHVFTAPHSHLQAAGPECVRDGVVLGYTLRGNKVTSWELNAECAQLLAYFHSRHNHLPVKQKSACKNRTATEQLLSQP